MPKFTQKIYRYGSSSCVDVPPAICAALGKTGSVPVKGILNEVGFRATLVPIDGGKHRLYITERTQTEAVVKVGDLVELILEVDTEPREQAVPPLLEVALNRRPLAKSRFNAFPPSHKKQILTYLNSLKTPETLQRDVNQLISKLEKG